MYLNFYNWAMHLFGASLGLISKFNNKLRLGHQGRKDIFPRLQQAISGSEKIIWFHAASLGEAEQAVPIMEAVRREYSQHQILLTFFSPSGMEHFKRKDLADHIFYLPFDTARNARRFLDIVNPHLAFFVKYEIWPNYFREIQKRQIPMIIAPAVFLPEFFYFRAPHKKFFIPLLQGADRILVQDERSHKLLAEHGVASAICGDSRFDRVLQNVQTDFQDATMEQFSKDGNILIGGSSWEAEEELLVQLLGDFDQLKVILAPHDISSENIRRILKLFSKFSPSRYSEKSLKGDNRVLIIDNIGMLSRLYRYGDMALIGGAFGKGIHNSLEAAAYGLPVFFGPNHQAFIEPRMMIEAGFAHEITNYADLKFLISDLLQKPDKLRQQQAEARRFVEEHSGSVNIIMNTIRELL